MTPCSSSAALALDDFSALAGWDNNWAPASVATGTTSILGLGASGCSACSEGARSVFALRSGSL